MPLCICSQLGKIQLAGSQWNTFSPSRAGRPAVLLSAGCFLTLLDDLGYLKGNVFSVYKALDPGFSVMAAKEILPQISYRAPAAVRQGRKPAYPETT